LGKLNTLSGASLGREIALLLARICLTALGGVSSTRGDEKAVGMEVARAWHGDTSISIKTDAKRYRLLLPAPLIWADKVESILKKLEDDEWRSTWLAVRMGKGKERWRRYAR